MSSQDFVCPEPGCGEYFEHAFQQHDHAEATGHRAVQRCHNTRNAAGTRKNTSCERQKFHPGVCSRENHFGYSVTWNSPLQKAMLDAVQYEAAAGGSLVELRRVMEEFADALGYPKGASEDASVDRDWFFKQHTEWFDRAVAGTLFGGML